MKLMKLEALRGFAAIYVIIYHLLLNIQFSAGGFDLLFPLRFGQEAVILFFLLSGFVIKYSFEHSKDKSFVNYFLKRFTRIYIPLLFVFALSYFLQCINIGKFVNLKLGNLFANLLMLQDVSIKPNVFFSTYMGNVPLWSLAYEWWFYMIFYLFYKFCSPNYLKRIVLIIVLTAGISFIIYPFFLNRYLFYFGIWWVGVEFANLYLQKREFSFKTVRFSIFILLSCTSITVFNLLIHYSHTSHLSVGMSPFLEVRQFLFATVAVICSVFWYKIKWKGFDKVFGFFAFFSPITYTIYIVHWPLLINRGYLNFINSETIRLFIAIVLTFSFAYYLEMKIYPPVKVWAFRLIYQKQKNGLI